MSRINVRGLTGKDIIPDLSPDKLAELQKMQLDIERIKANKHLDGENLSNLKQTRTWGTIVVLLLISLFCWLSIPKFLSQRMAIKNGYCFVDGDMVSKENVPVALQYKYAKMLSKDGKMSLSIPYLITYSSDSKIQAEMNNQIIAYLKSVPKVEPPKQEPTVELPKNWK
jgi:hypothetical protein